MDAGVRQDLRKIGHLVARGKPHVEVIILTAGKAVPVSVLPQRGGPAHDGGVGQATTEQELRVDIR